MSKLTFAIDFDGCLTEYSFPEIGEQTKEQKELLDVLIRLKKEVIQAIKNMELHFMMMNLIYINGLIIYKKN